jgi:transcriptional regulator ATRX
VLRYNSNRYEIEMQRRRDLESEDESEGSLKDFIDDSESAASTSSSSSDDQSGDEDATSIHSDDPKKGKKKKRKKQKHSVLPRRTRATAAESESSFVPYPTLPSFNLFPVPSDHEADEAAASAQKKENPTEWWMQICPEEELNNLEHSSKLMLLMSILEECEAIGDKL